VGGGTKAAYSSSRIATTAQQTDIAFVFVRGSLQVATACGGACPHEHGKNVSVNKLRSTIPLRPHIISRLSINLCLLTGGGFLAAATLLGPPPPAPGLAPKLGHYQVDLSSTFVITVDGAWGFSSLFRALSGEYPRPPVSRTGTGKTPRLAHELIAMPTSA
jgi:hypothetical protein